jgi:hypothetical protein
LGLGCNHLDRCQVLSFLPNSAPTLADRPRASRLPCLPLLKLWLPDSDSQEALAVPLAQDASPPPQAMTAWWLLTALSLHWCVELWQAAVWT